MTDYGDICMFFFGPNNSYSCLCRVDVTVYTHVGTVQLTRNLNASVEYERFYS